MDKRILKSTLSMIITVPIMAFANEPQPPAPSESDGIIGGH